MLRTLILSALVTVMLPGMTSSAAAQAAPGNVVTPAPPPREGTVGPEQLRDFSLPGTRPAPAPAPADPAPAPATPPRADRPVPDAARPASPRPAAPTVTRPITAQPPPRTLRSEEVDTAPREQVTVGLGAPVATAPGSGTDAAPLSGTDFAAPPPAPVAPVPTPLAPGQSLPWWPWLLAAALAAGAAGLFLARRRRVAPAGATATMLAPAPQPEPEPALPTGLVTTRLRAAPPPTPRPAPAPPREPAPAIAGGIVSTRLKAVVSLDLVAVEVGFDAAAASIGFRLRLLNSGSGPARDIRVEALPLNAGEDQDRLIADFVARPSAAAGGIAILPPLGATEIDHRLQMPRDAIRPYAAQGREVFVPVIAFKATYRTGAGEERVAAAFLLGGGSAAGDERLAPLPLVAGERPARPASARRLPPVRESAAAAR